MLSALPTPADLGLSPQLFPSFREGQLDIATQLALSPARFPELNMPCGGGKSVVYYTAALMFDLRLLILTPQKALQDQLMRDFGPPHGDLADVRGQANYPCPKYHNCEIGAANECPLRRAATATASCPNIAAIDHARASRRVVTNHAFWMTQGRAQSSARLGEPPPGIGSFDLIVLDEGHGTPERLADFCSVSLIEKELEQLLDIEVPSTTALDTWSMWARATAARVPEAMRLAGSPRERMRLLSIGRDLAELSGVSSDREVRWIYQSGSGPDLGKHTFSPVWATPYAESLLFQGTGKVILTSATLLPSIGKYLGISPDEEEYIDVVSGFDPSNRPFIYTPSGVSVSYRSTPSDIRVLTSKYDQIIDLWRGYKGLYHTQSYALQDKILSSTRNRHRLIVCERGGLSAAEAIKQLKQSHSDMIAMGPAFKEGYDLPDDDARFQVIARIPMLNHTDPVIAARIESIPSYSMDQTAIQLMQATGRIVRRQGDWGFSYCADGAWGRVRKQANFPDSFMRAERWENDRVPGPPKGLI